jgi:hypothetical protein
MGRTFSLVAIIILSIILTIFIIGFVVLESTYENLNEKSFEQVLGETSAEIIKDVFEETIDNKTREFNFSSLYPELLAECEGESFVFIEEIEFELDCDELERAGSEGVEDLLKEKFGEKIEENLNEALFEEQEIESVSKLFSIIRIALWILGILSLAIIISIIFISSPKYPSAIALGVVGIIAGLPFLFIKGFNISVNYVNNPSLSGLADSISSSLFVNFLIVFILGTILFFIGLLSKKRRRKAK